MKKAYLLISVGHAVADIWVGGPEGATGAGSEIANWARSEMWLRIAASAAAPSRDIKDSNTTVCLSANSKSGRCVTDTVKNVVVASRSDCHNCFKTRFPDNSTI